MEVFRIINNLPRRDKSHIQQSRSILAFHTIIPDNLFIIRKESEDDYGTDLLIELVTPSGYATNLYNALPSSWEYLGKIDNYFSKKMVVGLILEVEYLNISDEIIIQNGNTYFKQTISSIRINNDEVETVKKGDAVSFEVNIPINKYANIFVIRK